MQVGWPRNRIFWSDILRFVTGAFTGRQKGFGVPLSTGACEMQQVDDEAGNDAVPGWG